MKDETFYNIKIAAGFLVLATVLGWVWYFDSFNILWHMYFSTMTISLVGIVVFPRKIYRSSFRHLFAAIFVITIIATLPVLYQDITLVNGPDSPAIVIRSVQVYILYLMTREAISNTVKTHNAA